jgi:hypothetical protein
VTARSDAFLVFRDENRTAGDLAVARRLRFATSARSLATPDAELFALLMRPLSAFELDLADVTDRERFDPPDLRLWIEYPRRQTTAVGTNVALRIEHHRTPYRSPLPFLTMPSPNRSQAVDVTALTEHPKNPRQGDVGAIIESIEANGWFGAIVAQLSTGFVLDGNHRLRAMRMLGESKIQTVFVDVDDATALRILLSANKVGDRATYDDPLLIEVLTLIDQNDSLVGTGWDGDDLDLLISDLEEPLGEVGDAPMFEPFENKWGVIVEAPTEEQQLELLAEMNGRGHTCRALMS